MNAPAEPAPVAQPSAEFLAVNVTWSQPGLQEHLAKDMQVTLVHRPAADPRPFSLIIPAVNGTVTIQLNEAARLKMIDALTVPPAAVE